MELEQLDTREKALKINLDPLRYGTFAEIGAGQEVARRFFRVGGASGTIAKSMSAYDMTFSDTIYGPTERYVSRDRLERMLGYEYQLLLERLEKKRGDKTCFFAFADTVKARGYRNKEECDGWVGMRFQTKPGDEPSQIMLHVRMLDNENYQQQEALGIVGVNLIFGAFYLNQQPLALTRSLLDDLSTQRIEVDLLKFSGPAFPNVDNRLVALQLVELGLSDATMFTARGDVLQPAEMLYKKHVLVERGSFRPVTRTTVNMLESAQSQFIQEPQVNPDEVVVLMEMTIKHLTDKGAINPQDFLDRADMLGALGMSVLISNFGAYHRLAAYLFRYTKKMSGLVIGVPHLKQLFDSKYYTDLEGGILESIGRLFKNELKLYAYPMQGALRGTTITAANLRVAPEIRHLYAYLLENEFIHALKDIDVTCLPIQAHDVLKSIQEGDAAWEPMVPPVVAGLIKHRRLFGYRASAPSRKP